MKKEFQNSSGFLKTGLVSSESLIPEVSNFEFLPKDGTSFSDTQLNIPERLMLGKRAERYFSEWLKQSSDFDLIAENIQVIDQKQTLGEFDFIVRRKSNNQLIHIELVYKFYLYDTAVQGTEFEHWIGPNRGDQLDFKLDKLQNHQFPLLNTEPAQLLLKSLGIDVSNIEQHVLFLANLFVPVDAEVEFNSVNPDAIEGSWMNFDHWEKNANSDNKFALPQKTNWFSRELIDPKWLAKNEANEMIKEMHDRKRSPLVYQLDADGTQSRDFVVWW